MLMCHTNVKSQMSYFLHAGRSLVTVKLYSIAAPTNTETWTVETKLNAARKGRGAYLEA